MAIVLGILSIILTHECKNSYTNGVFLKRHFVSLQSIPIDTRLVRDPGWHSRSNLIDTLVLGNIRGCLNLESVSTFVKDEIIPRLEVFGNGMVGVDDPGVGVKGYHILRLGIRFQKFGDNAMSRKFHLGAGDEIGVAMGLKEGDGVV